MLNCSVQAEISTVWLCKETSSNFFFIYCKILPTSFSGYFGHVWTLLSKTIIPACTKFDVYLHAKMWTPFLTSFLRNCKDIAKLLLCELWECLTIPIKIIVPICSKLSCLSACKKMNFIIHYFFKILQKNSKLKMIVSISGNLWRLSTGKKQLHPSLSF